MKIKLITVLFCTTFFSFAQITFNGNITEAEWGSPHATSSGGPSPGFGSGHEVNAFYSFGDATYIYFAVAGNVQNGNRILVFIDSKSGGFNTANFNRTNAPEGIDNFNSSTTFDSGFDPDFCAVIGTFSGNYFFDLFTLTSGTGSSNYLGDSNVGGGGSDESGVGANPANSDNDNGFEFRVSKSNLGYSDGNEIKIFVAYTSDGGYLSNQFLTRAANTDGNYEAGSVSFGAATPNHITIPSGTLPVELSSFSAIVKGKGIELAWKTASEVNNHGFEVERADVRDQTSDVRWNKVGFVEGNGTTNAAQQYAFTDNGVAAGKYSYRLKQIDRDGKFTYSNVVEAKVGLAPSTVELHGNYPNPFNPSTSLSFMLGSSGRASLKVYDVLGKEVATVAEGLFNAGELNTFNFNATGLTSGVYYYRLISDAKIETKSMILMK